MTRRPRPTDQGPLDASWDETFERLRSFIAARVATTRSPPTSPRT